jgi:hypothetical protein
MVIFTSPLRKVVTDRPGTWRCLACGEQHNKI